MPSIDEWIKICVYVCTHTHTRTYMLTYFSYFSAIIKNESLPFETTKLDLEDMMLSEISQTEKDKYFMLLLICGI